MVENQDDLRTVLAGSALRVGYCRRGAAEGRYILLFPMGDAFGKHRWEVSFSSGYLHDGQYFNEPYETYSTWDSKSAASLEFLESLEIEWAPRKLTGLVVRDMFPGVVEHPDLAISEAPPARPYGRVTDFQGFMRLQKAGCRPEHLAPLGEDQCTLVGDDGTIDQDWLDANGDVVNGLLSALQNFDYTLAIVPITGGLLWQHADPWSEFRSQLPSATQSGGIEAGDEDFETYLDEESLHVSSEWSVHDVGLESAREILAAARARLPTGIVVDDVEIVVAEGLGYGLPSMRGMELASSDRERTVQLWPEDDETVWLRLLDRSNDAPVELRAPLRVDEDSRLVASLMMGDYRPTRSLFGRRYLVTTRSDVSRTRLLTDRRASKK